MTDLRDLVAQARARADCVGQSVFFLKGADVLLRELADVVEARLVAKYPDRTSWPSNGIEFNRWYLDLPRFVEKLKTFEWTQKSQCKYITITVDTRDYYGNGQAFKLRDRDGAEIGPEDMFPYT